jgi:hypothetical protein
MNLLMEFSLWSENENRKLKTKDKSSCVDSHQTRASTDAACCRSSRPIAASSCMLEAREPELELFPAAIPTGRQKLTAPRSLRNAIAEAHAFRPLQPDFGPVGPDDIEGA